MENAIVILILLCIVGGIVWYLVKQKKKGAACVGCPYSKQCTSKCTCNKSDDKSRS